MLEGGIYSGTGRSPRVAPSLEWWQRLCWCSVHTHVAIPVPPSPTSSDKGLCQRSEGFLSGLIGAWQATCAVDFVLLLVILTSATVGLGRQIPQPSTWDQRTLSLTAPSAHVES